MTKLQKKLSLLVEELVPRIEALSLPLSSFLLIIGGCFTLVRMNSVSPCSSRAGSILPVMVLNSVSIVVFVQHGSLLPVGVDCTILLADYQLKAGLPLFDEER